MLDYLIHELRWNASYGCPIYYALHYRNFKALSLLLNSSGIDESLYCLSMTDSLGLTALHVAAKCKASGFARFYSRLFDKNGFVKNLPMDVTSLLGLSQKVFHHLTIIGVEPLSCELNDHFFICLNMTIYKLPT